MIAPPNPALGSTAAERDGFTFNKDSNQVVCPAGRTSKPGVRKTYAKEHGRQAYMYYFDVDQCQCYPLRDGCYKPGAKSKSYSIPILTDLQKEFLARSKTPEFREKYKKRMVSERVNALLKNNNGLRKARGKGCII